MNKKKILILIIVICLVAAGVYFILKFKSKNKNELTLYGNIEIRTVDLGFRVEGLVSKLYFEEGDSVKKGDLLALIDNTNYLATYEKGVADIKRAQSASANAEAKYERNKELCVDETVSKQDCDDLLNSKNEAKAALNSMIAQTKLNKNNLDDTKIYAPDDGIITTRVQEVGASVLPAQPVYVMSKTNPVWIRAYVSEVNLGNIKYNMKARVLTDSVDPKTGKKREYVGRIGYISPVAEFTPKSVETTDLRTDLVYRIRVYVDEVDEFLRQGMPTTVVIDLVDKK